MFASKTTRGFYCSEIHGAKMPDDVVEITAEEHAALLEGQVQGKVIDFDEAGRPFLADPPPPTQGQINAEARAYLASTDWYIVRQQETGEPIPAEVIKQRSDARAKVVEK